ncbi:MAG: multimeric flavodoxin WrbA, partial [Firmicutes bacterium]|nr:multimeric flavodoxin WrbA [Bacillota bacterium]
DWNTAALLDHALKGAASHGGLSELFHLYDFNYTGCISCFSCKLKGNNNPGTCAVKDELTPILEKVQQADALILGSPIYLGAISGKMKSFLERLIFPYLVYDTNHSTLFNRKIPTGFIYTLGVNESRMQTAGYDQPFHITKMLMEKIFGSSELLIVTDTYQFDDYSKYVATAFNPEEKAKRKKEQFPIDCDRAFAMGARFVMN